jgi:hypothetical protein
MRNAHKRTLLRAESEEAFAPVGGRLSLATFTGICEGRWMVQLSSADTSVAALSIVPLHPGDTGATVVVGYEEGDATRPIIVGRLQQAPGRQTHLRADGERVVIQGEREIELRCGDASIVLTRAGKVLIRGRYLLSRSRGANKIKGAYVDIN